MVLNPAGILLLKLLKDERINDFSEFTALEIYSLMLLFTYRKFKTFFESEH